MAKLLITGMAGGLANLVARRAIALGHEVTGVDYRPAPQLLPTGVEFHRANYNKTRIEDVFRRCQPDVVLHLGRVGNLKVLPNKRFDLNVIGSAKVFELCLKYGVQRLLVLSTFHIYGAHPNNHVPIFEDEPLRAAQTFPQLADAVQLDNQACTWVWRHRKLRTVVLRPCNVVGAHINNAVSTYLRQPVQSYLLGFNPMWQLIGEDDLVEAVTSAWQGEAVGVFNVAGAEAVPLVSALKLTGSSLWPVPGFFAEAFLWARGRLAGGLPPYLLDFFRYPCVISDARFRQAFRWQPARGVRETVRAAMHIAR